MKVTFEQKQRLYNMLRDCTIVANLVGNGEVLGSPVKCRTFFNRALHEITDENHDSFRKISIKFALTSAYLSEIRAIRPKYENIIFTGIQGNTPCGVLYKYNLTDGSTEIPTEDSEFYVEISLEE